jgi:hypothetical protein
MAGNNGLATTRSAELERIAHYHEQAAQYRQWAADETVAEARDGLLDMARQYDRLAGELEAKTGIAATRSPTIAEHDMQAKRVSGATDAQAASAIDMKVVEDIGGGLLRLTGSLRKRSQKIISSASLT